MTNVYCLVIDGKLYMKGSLSSIEREIQKFNFTNYLKINYDEYQKTRITDKKKKKMADMNHPYNWKKVPKHEYPRVRELIERQKFDSLLKLHDDYEVSKNSFCCGEAVRTTFFNQWKWQMAKGTFND